MAARFLQNKGLILVHANYGTKAGEVDLIMRDKQTLVFVEVRYRRHRDWASAEESITQSKQLKIIKAASQYLQQKRLTDKVNCRFDVVAINGHLTPPRINWITDAFQQTLF
jgi:putative endonuclease